MCCIPVFLIFIFVIACIITGIVLLCVNGVHDFSETEYTAETSVLIGIAIIVGVALIGNCYTWARILVNIIISPRRRVQMIASKVDSISGMETVIQVSHDALCTCRYMIYSKGAGTLMTENKWKNLNKRNSSSDESSFIKILYTCKDVSRTMVRVIQ